MEKVRATMAMVAGMMMMHSTHILRRNMDGRIW